MCSEPCWRRSGGMAYTRWLRCLLLALAASVCLCDCPCSDPALCQPITHTRDFEVFVFYTRGKSWKRYDWSQVTTVALFTKHDPELMCFAHSKGARYVLKGDLPVKYIVEPTRRASWIEEKVNLAKSQYMDGINLDIEHQVTWGPLYYALTDLVKETTEAFHREIPGSQVTFDVAWNPNCVDNRCYNYAAIAELTDFLFVMSYDEQSQIWTECIAGANAPFNQTIIGYEQFINLSIDPKKLVMGVPWYGYDYACLQLTEGNPVQPKNSSMDYFQKDEPTTTRKLFATKEYIEGLLLENCGHINKPGTNRKPEDNRCKLKAVPFRGAPCSDAASRQVAYRTIMKQVNSSLTGRLWDDQQKAPFYNYKDTKGNIHQVWYDDPKSISLKAANVKKLGLRGIGMWNGDLLDYTDDPIAQQQSMAMWKALIP